MLITFQGTTPRVAADVFLAEGTQIIGAVEIAEGASIWFNAVLRGDNTSIKIGAHSNVQDNCVVHVDPGYPCEIGEGVTVGHGAVVHGATIESNVLIGMHSTVLNGARIGRDSIVGAGALVTENAQIPAGSLVVGIPGKVVRALRPDEIEFVRKSASGYYARSRLYSG